MSFYNKTQSTQNESFFTKALRESGVTFTNDESPIILTQEQSLVIRDLEKNLKNHEAFPINLQEFMKGLKKYVESEGNMSKLLTKTILQKQNYESQDIQQECLVRLLLSISLIQKEVIDLILEQLTAITIDDNSDPGKLRLLLNSLRYLSYVQNASSLTTKLLDIIDVSAFPCQLEILYAIPEILPDSQNDEVASKLSTLLESNSNLTGAIIDCLNALNLSTTARNEVQQIIIDNLFTASSLSIFPIILEFLTSDCKSQNLKNTVLQIRNALDIIVGNESASQEAETRKIVALDKFRSCSCNSKQLFEAWISMIGSINQPSDHKPIDLIILIILYSTGTTRKKTIEIILKKRLKLGLFRTQILEKIFERYVGNKFIDDYLQTMIEITTSVLKTQNVPIVIDFVTKLCTLLFSHPLIVHAQKQDIIHNLILLTGLNDQNCVRNVLKILFEISRFTNQGHVFQMMSLLEKVEVYDVDNLKLVFNLLCDITCSPTADDTLSSLKNDIHMLIRKLLSSSKTNLKLKGIISAVMMAKHLGKSPDGNQDESVNESILNIFDLPNGALQEAAGLLELVNISSSASTELMGLYYDELAAAITNTELDKYLIMWLSETITNNFQDTFITEIVPNAINDIPVSDQYSLNSTEEVNIMVSLNIAEHSMKSDCESNENDIVILSPLFRLLRLIHYKEQNGDLSSIDALLGCGIVLPTVDDINQFDKQQTQQIINCTFYCINWFREIINAFVTQKNKSLRQKVLQRLQQLTELEMLLQNYLQKLPDYKLPSCYFDGQIKQLKQKQSNKAEGTAEVIKQPKKKLKTNKSNETSDSAGQLQSKSPKKQFQVNFREIDTDIILLLKYPLNFPDVEQTQHTQTQSAKLEIGQFKFLMKELCAKLNFSEKERITPNEINDINLITDTIRMLPCINQHFKVIKEKLKVLISESDGISDARILFTSEATNLKQSFSLILMCFYELFNWNGFQKPKNLNLYRDCLKALGYNEPSQLNSTNKMISELIKKFYEQTDLCLDLTSAIYLIHVMQALYRNYMNNDIRKKITSACEKLLMRKWFNVDGELENGKEYIANIDYLIKTYLDGANTKIICDLVATLHTQCPNLKTKEDSLPMLQSVNKTSFYVLFKCLCNSLKHRVQEEIQSLTNNEHLVLWKLVVITMQNLMNVVKIFETRNNLICFLKKSLAILKIFLNSGIPILEIMLRSKALEVLEIFKMMQTTTRFLHHLCCYSKLTKDCSLIAYVPQFKLTLETFVYRVKAALVANNCSAAFWMGNLKNRDLHGDDILSQSSTVSENSNGENSDEELPEDDDDDNEESEITEENSNSASEIF